MRLPDPPDGASTCQETLDALVRRFAAQDALRRGGLMPLKDYPAPVEGLAVTLDPGMLPRAPRPPGAAQRDHRRHRARAVRDHRRRRLGRERPGDPPQRQRATTSAPASTCRSEARWPSKPRTGATQRQLRWHVNRLIPSMLECQTPIVASVHGLGDRARPRPRAGERLRGRRRRRPVLVAVHRHRLHARQRQLVAAAADGRRRPGEVDDHVRAQGHRSPGRASGA